jgi:hypothetical protein
MYMFLETCCCNSNLRFIVNNNAKYFAAWQQCKLYFHGNTQHSVHCRQATSTLITINKVHCFLNPPPHNPGVTSRNVRWCAVPMRWPRSYENNLDLGHIHVKIVSCIKIAYTTILHTYSCLWIRFIDGLTFYFPNDNVKVRKKFNLLYSRHEWCYFKLLLLRVRSI